MEYYYRPFEIEVVWIRPVAFKVSLTNEYLDDFCYQLKGFPTLNLPDGSSIMIEYNNSSLNTNTS